MKRIHSLVLVTVLVSAAAACSPGKSKPSKNQPQAQPAPGAPAVAPPGGTASVDPSAPTPTSYELKGKNDREESCTTGPQKYETLEAKCVGLMDPVRNGGDCARPQRAMIFESDCAPLGHSMFESHSCRVSLVKKTARISGNGSFDDKDLVKSAEYCAGRVEDGTDLNGVYVTDELAKGVFADVVMDFYPAANAGPGMYSTFKLRMWKDVRGGKQPLMQDFVYVDKGGDEANVQALDYGVTADGKYKYVVNCGVTWGCPAPKAAAELTE